MKLVSHYIESMKNAEIFPIISTLIFFALFVYLLIWAIKYDKKVVNEMKDLPLDSSENNNDNKKY